MKNYKYYEVTTCRLAIRLCIGYGPNGRKKHRTFPMRGINPNASWEGIMAVIRALAPVLEFPIVDVQKVTSRKIFFYEDAAPVAPAVVLSVPVEAKIIPAEPVDSLDMEIAIWEEMRAKEEQEMQAKIAIALMYMYWAWKMSHQRGGFIMERAPPARML